MYESFITSKITILSLLCLSFSLSLQYAFMFQWPRLPELLLSMQDYKFLENMFRTERMVCLNNTVMQYPMFDHVFMLLWILNKDTYDSFGKIV